LYSLQLGYGKTVHLPDHTVSKTRTQQHEYSPPQNIKILKLRMIIIKITCKNPQNSQYTNEVKVKVSQNLIKNQSMRVLCGSGGVNPYIIKLSNA
jgi:hypothetical protein